jgi:hypothetical protein
MNERIWAASRGYIKVTAPAAGAENASTGTVFERAPEQEGAQELPGAARTRELYEREKPEELGGREC